MTILKQIDEISHGLIETRGREVKGMGYCMGILVPRSAVALKIYVLLSLLCM